VPEDLAIDPDGTVWVIDQRSQQVHRLDADGALIESLAGPAGDATFLDSGADLRAIAIDADGSLLLADQAATRIMRLTADGTLLDQWGSKGSGERQFEQVGDIAIDGAGDIYVLDITLNRIQKFTAEGEYLATVDGSGDGQLVSPGQLGLDTQNNLYVPDGSRIVVFAPNGSLLRVFGEDALEFATAVTVDTEDRIFVADGGQDNVHVFDQTGDTIATWGEGGGNPGDFNFPQTLDIDESGHLYVIDYGNGRIEAFLIVPDPGNASPVA
jgi:DNA-binding beta-propeller fold protein YncE